MSKAVLIPGNGCSGLSDLSDVMWYGALAASLRKQGLSIRTPAFPDPVRAREPIWKDFAVNSLGLDDSTIVIGHSSGAACALRLMEERKSAGCVLIAAYDSDLGDDLERQSGYFSRPFDYVAMRRNTPWIVQFHAVNDHLVPVDVARRVAAGFRAAEAACIDGSLGTFEYVESPTDGHFQEDEYPQFLSAILAQLERGRGAR